MSYDTKCEELAAYFMQGTEIHENYRAELASLAQAIQDAIEDWIAGKETPQP